MVGIFLLVRSSYYSKGNSNINYTLVRLRTGCVRAVTTLAAAAAFVVESFFCGKARLFAQYVYKIAYMYISDDTPHTQK